jgi:hypothetical protein
MTRSSDLGLANDPLGYLIRRRLGLASTFSDSEAMNCGSWFHRAFHYPDPRVDLAPALFTKERFLVEASALAGANSDDVIGLEQKDFSTACAWAEAARTVRFLDEAEGFAGNYNEWLTRPGFRLLGIEVIVVAKDPRLSQLCVAQIDMLFFNEKTHALRPLDIKTTAQTPSERFARCPIEPQTHHYPRVCEWNIEGIINKFDLPGDTFVDGMYHLGVQKPTIKLCGKDRDYTEEPHTLKSGPRKGQVEMRKTYYGDPVYENFVGRCVDMYHGEGEYADKAMDRMSDPPVNISFTPIEVLKNRTYMYNAWAERASRLANAVLEIETFPPSPNSLWRETPMAPFYLMDPGQWQSIMYQDALRIIDRDEGLPREPAVVVLGKELPVL